MLRISNVKMKVEHDEMALKIKISKMLKVSIDDMRHFAIAKKSLDARDKVNIRFVYAVDVVLGDERPFIGQKDIAYIEPFTYTVKKPDIKLVNKPVVVGSGPAGLFCALILARAGFEPIILERGQMVEDRKRDVDLFFATGRLNTQSNVQFGEGGAGTFSDGKLTTGIRDERIGLVLREFVNMGAPKEIIYDAKPHIGTDNLINIVRNMRREIIGLNGKFLFSHQMTGLKIKDGALCGVEVSTPDGETFVLDTENAVMAIGHSARDTVEMLYKNGIQIRQKAFAVGVRIEHAQEMINKCQYGELHDSPFLDAADYKLAVKLHNGRGAYTFCMCPGGRVIAAASEEHMLATNGMSLFDRNMPNANSALLVTVPTSDFGSNHPLAGIEYQRELERRAYDAGGGGYYAPAQRVEDFLINKKTTDFTGLSPSYLPGVTGAELTDIFSSRMIQDLQEAILLMDKKIRGFANADAVLTAVESRSSSPVVIERSSSLQSNITGIYPCGEGCGHAGGIISSAVDGIKCAEKLMSCH